MYAFSIAVLKNFFLSVPGNRHEQQGGY